REFASNRVWWSRELEELLGFNQGGFPGTTEAFRDLVHHDDRAAVAGAVEQAVADGCDYLVEFRVRHADGDWRWMEGRGRATYAAGGEPLMLYGLGIDITGRKHAESILLQHESRLRQLNAQLSEADRRKDEFLATLAHELRNPLAPMRNVAEVLRLKKLDDDPQLRWSRDVLERQLEHLSHLVDDLLDVSRITQGKLEPRMQPLELAAAIHDAIESAKPLIDEFAHELTLQLPQEPVVLNADPVRIIQVVLNLLNNAAKYTPRGGRIFLCAERIGDEAVITVRDSGIGIPEQHLSHIFDMFSQLSPALDRSQGGLGIGLALVRGMVELHGGSVSASSPGVGEGSTFEIRLPLAATQQIPHPLRGAQESAPMSAASIRRVLVVDDNEDAAESLAMLLSLQDHVVRTANDGMSALAIAADFAPDVVLLDIGLPHLNGYEVARRIRQARWGSGVLLLAISGWGQEQDKKTAADAGFDGHLTKPIDPVALISLLAAHRQPHSSAAG
ncbi:MAG: ATP-binding protein, partial [Dokdonella sp.]